MMYIEVRNNDSYDLSCTYYSLDHCFSSIVCVEDLFGVFVSVLITSSKSLAQLKCFDETTNYFVCAHQCSFIFSSLC